MGGHFRSATTYMVVRQCFFWPGMLNVVEDNTKGSDTCVRVNQWAGNIVSLISPLPVPQHDSECVGVDIMCHLSTSLSGNNCIVSFVDHFAKRAHWMPCTKTINSTEFALIFLEAIIWLHGVPWEIVSDRDTQFTSDCWAEVSKRSQTNLLMSMVFYLQTDRLSEVSNQQVMQHLYAFTTHHQYQQDKMLPLGEYSYNTSTHLSTDWTTIELTQSATGSITWGIVAGRWQHDTMRSLAGALFIGQLQSSLQDAQNCHHEKRDNQTMQSNRS